MKKSKQNQPKKSNPNRDVDKAVKRIAHIERQLRDQAPIAISGTNPASKARPSFSRMKDGVRIEHTEVFVWPIGTSSYSVDSTHVNPGHSEMFNWLSQVALAFEEYEFDYLRFRYRPRCATTQAGEIVLALDPKSGDTSPASLAIVSTYRIREQGPMWKEMVLNVPAEQLRAARRRYIRPGSGASPDVNSLYDVGKFLFPRDGASPSGAIIGEISVEYAVRLYVPAQDPQGNVNAGWVNAATSITISAPFGTAPVHGGRLIDSVIGNTVFLKDMDATFDGTAYYSVWIYATGTGLSNLGLAGTNLTVANPLVTAIGAGTALMYHARINVTNHAAEHYLALTFTGTTVTDTLFQVARDAVGQTF